MLDDSEEGEEGRFEESDDELERLYEEIKGRRATRDQLYANVAGVGSSSVEYSGATKSALGKMMNQFVEDSSSEDSEEEDPDIWSKNNNKVVSSYIRKIAEPGTGPRFDLSKSLLRLDRRHNVMKHMVKSMSRKDIQWVRDNFMSVFCKVCVINEETGRCYCGRHPQEHRQIPHSIREGEESLTEWSKESCLAKESTDGLGRLLFDDDDHFASRYIRLSEDTPQELVFKLLKNKWRVNNPGMVVSTIGSLDNFNIKREVKSLIKHGIIKAVSKTTGWIISSGLDKGFVKVIGDAVHQYGYPFPCIGIAHWGSLEDRSYLQSKQSLFERVNYLKYSEYAKKSDQTENRLETHHTHFFFVDDGLSCLGTDADEKFRKRFEQFILENLKTPIVVILLQGEVDAFQRVSECLKNKIPVIATAGHGKLPYFLKYAVDHLTEVQLHPKTTTIKENNQEVCLCSVDTKNVQRCPEVLHQLKKIHGQNSKTSIEQFLVNLSEVAPLLGGITFFDEKESFDGVIFQALMKKNKSSLQSQLELALRWDRLEIAQEIVKLHNTASPEGQFALSLALFNSIVNDRPDFVEFLLNCGGDVTQVQNSFSGLISDIPVPHFVRLLEKHSTYEVFSDDTSNEIPAHEGSLKREGTTNSLSKTSDVQHNIQVRHYDELLNNVLGNWYGARTGLEEDPFYELMVLHIFLLREELAMSMWSRTEQPEKAALAACFILSRLKKCSGYAIGSDEELIIKEMYVAFEAAAVGTIKEAYRENPKVCMINMTVPWKRFKNCNLLNIAWGAHSKKFLGTRPAQEVIKKRWRGQIRRHVAFHKTFFVSILPILLLFPKLIPFRPHVLYKIDGHEMEIVNKKDKEKKRTGLNAWMCRVKAFYSSPIIKFQNHAFFYILFLVLHAYVVLFEMGESEKWHNKWVLLLFTVVAMYMIEELRQIFKTNYMFRHHYFDNFWNRIDALMYSLYVIGSVLWLFGTDYTVYSMSRAVLCVNTLLLFTRLLFLSNADQNMGTLLLILKEMSVDFINISILIIIFVMGYGIALVGLIVEPDEFETSNLIAIFFYPYFQIFGETHLEHLIKYEVKINGSEVPLYLSRDVTPVNFTRGTTIALVAVYMAVVAIGFVNLLIAMFSDTYRRIKDNQINVWKYQRYGICEEYESAAPPPPFSVIVLLLETIRTIYRCFIPYPSLLKEDDNDKRITKWKEHVLQSLMKEASITYLKRERKSVEGNLRNVMNDVAKPLQDQIALLDLQTKLLQKEQLSKTAVKRLKSTNSRRESEHASGKSYISRHWFKKKRMSGSNSNKDDIEGNINQKDDPQSSLPDDYV